MASKLGPTLAGLSTMVALALAGCTGGIDGPDDRLPGVRTQTTVDDAFVCGALLFPHGCVIVRIERADSGCVPEVGGYVVCNATIAWSATSGAVEPGSRLTTSVNGTAGPSCDPMPGEPCQTAGVVEHVRHFDGPGENDTWDLEFAAVLETPSGQPATSGSFLLLLRLDTQTEGTDALAS